MQERCLSVAAEVEESWGEAIAWGEGLLKEVGTGDDCEVGLTFRGTAWGVGLATNTGAVCGEAKILHLPSFFIPTASWATRVEA